MKYFLFAFRKYECSGGLGDFAGTFDSIEDAKKEFEECRNDGCDFGEIAAFDGDSIEEVARFTSWNPATYESVAPGWHEVKDSVMVA